jgi:hypothetical protein
MGTHTDKQKMCKADREKIIVMTEKEVREKNLALSPPLLGPRRESRSKIWV